MPVSARAEKRDQNQQHCEHLHEPNGDFSSHYPEQKAVVDLRRVRLHSPDAQPRTYGDQ